MPRSLMKSVQGTKEQQKMAAGDLWSERVVRVKILYYYSVKWCKDVEVDGVAWRKLLPQTRAQGDFAAMASLKGQIQSNPWFVWN